MPAEHRVLVTGANGFVGGWLQRELEARRQSVKLEVFPASHLESPERHLDVTDYGQVDRLIREVRPTAVIHLAAIAAPADARDAPFRAWEVNLNGTMNLAYAVLASAPEARFVFVSSSEVYGDSFNDLPAGEPIKESAALKPVNVYGATKAAADNLVGQLAHDGLKSIRFRPFNHTGPGQSEAYVVPAFARQIAEIAAHHRPPTIDVGNLRVHRDFLDVRDVVRAYANAALSDIPEAYGQAFNLASGNPRRIGDILDGLIGLSGIRIDVRVDPARLRPVEVETASGDATAASKTLGWTPEVPFNTTLRDVLDDWKERLSAPGPADRNRATKTPDWISAMPKQSDPPDHA